MKSLIVAVVALVGLNGCIAVPAPYYPESGYYHSTPAIGVGVYPGYGYHRHHHYRRHWHRW